MTVGVLQTFPGQSRATGRGTDDEPAAHLVTGRPQSVSGALETEHGVKHIDRNQRFTLRGVGRSHVGESGGGAGLVDADVQNLALRALLVGEELGVVDRGVVLAVGVVDLRVREERVDAEGSSLVGDDRNDAVSEVLGAQQLFEQSHERHGRGDLLRSGPLLGDRVGLISGQVELGVCGASLWQVAAERAPTLVHVLDRLVLVAGGVVGRQVGVFLELGIRDRHVHAVTERLEVVEGHLLHLVGRVAALEAGTEAVALDRFREDDGRLAGVLRRRLERGIDLAVVVSTALEVPDLVVAQVLDELERTRVAAEEILAHVGAAFGLVRLVITIGRDVHQVDQGAVYVVLEQVVPLPTPDHLDDVPAGTTEEALELLDDLAVTAHRAVKALKVAVDDEVEVVEALVGGDLQLAAAFHLIHFTVAEECPDLLVAGILDAPVGQVAVELRLIDRVDRAETHGHGGELPEFRHEARVRIRGDAIGSVRFFLTETVELVLRQPALEEGTRVGAGGGMALNEDLVATARVVLAAEEMVETDFVQCSG